MTKLNSKAVSNGTTAQVQEAEDKLSDIDTLYKKYSSQTYLTASDRKTIKQTARALQKSLKNYNENSLMYKSTKTYMELFEDLVTEDGNTTAESTAMGVLEGYGVLPMTEAISKMSGDKESAVTLSNISSEAQSDHSVAYKVGDVAGSILLMLTSGAISGKAVSGAASALGAEELTGTAAKLAPTAVKAISGALTFGSTTAIQNAGRLATEQISAEEYAKQIDTSAFQGLAGGLASGMATMGMEKILAKAGLMTPFMTYVKNLVAGLAETGANVGTGYALTDEKPSNEEVALQLGMVFFMTGISGAIQSYNENAAAKARMESTYKVLEQSMEIEAYKVNGLPEEQRAQEIYSWIDALENLKSDASTAYVAGQQEGINKIIQYADAAEDVLYNYVGKSYSGTATGSYSGAAGSTGAETGINFGGVSGTAPTGTTDAENIQTASGEIQTEAEAAPMGLTLNNPT
jgi:hypothetical protein